MKTGAANHIHRYKKVNIGSKRTPFLVYKCMKPACSHYTRMDLAEGIICECNRCFNPMMITKAVLHHSSNKPMAKPHCTDCIKRRRSNAVEAIAAFLEGNKA